MHVCARADAASACTAGGERCECEAHRHPRARVAVARGHLEGAVNIDLQSSGFEAAIAELDPDNEYVVYCQSGNRSAQATDAMEAAGLDVQDAGGISEAEQATGLAVVQ